MSWAWSWAGQMMLVLKEGGSIRAGIFPEAGYYVVVYPGSDDAPGQHLTPALRRPSEAVAAVQGYFPSAPFPTEPSKWCTRIGGCLGENCCCWTRTCDTDEAEARLRKVLTSERVQQLKDFWQDPEIQAVWAESWARASRAANERRREHTAAGKAALEAHAPHAGRFPWMEPAGTTLLREPPVGGGRVIIVMYDGEPIDALVDRVGKGFARSSAFLFDGANTHGWYPFENYPALAARYVDIVRKRVDWTLRADGPLFLRTPWTP